MFNFFKLKPYHTGYLPAEDGHRVYYQEVGNPNGIPVISFHGGPGGSGRTKHAQIFNLKKYRVLLFDQRGCGLSTYQDPLYKNTTLKTVNDAKRLIEHLKIQRKVIISGGSFGATCALLFAETYPEYVSKLVLNSVFLARFKDADNASPIIKFFYPDFLNELQEQAGKKNIFDYYYGLLFSKKRSDQVKAVHYYRGLEHMAGLLNPSFTTTKISDDDIRRFRIFMHYQKNNFFLKENQLLKDAKKIIHIPTLIYQNRLDFCCPPYQAFELYQTLNKSKLVIVADQGHGSPKLFKTIRKDFE